MKFIFVIVLTIHGAIHLFGFFKAFGITEIKQLTFDVSKPIGLLWLLAATFIYLTAIFYGLKKEFWPIIALVAIIVSQVLIIIYWKDAKFGTLVNIILLLAAFIAFATFGFKNNYKKDVLNAMESVKINEEVITQTDLDTLPELIQNYLNYVGVVGKPKLKNMNIIFDGEMRDRGKSWFQFTAEQYNFFEEPSRLFFMTAKVKGLPTSGYHAYKNESASMLIKVLSIIPIIDLKKEKLYPTETVTYFNDLCLFAPAALIDTDIHWDVIDPLSIKATFSNHKATISAVLYFNEIGQLTNFVSDDRHSISENKNFRFSTPVKNYQLINGYNLPTYGEAIWHYPDGEFAYGKFNLKHIVYNVKDLQ